MGSNPVFPNGGNVVNPYTVPEGNYPGYPQTGVYAHTVDKVIGSAYDTVRYLAENLEYVKHVSAHLAEIYKVAQSTENIDIIVQNLDMLNEIHAHLNQLDAIYVNLTSLMNIHTNMASLLNIDANMPELLDLQANIDVLLDIEANVVSSETAPIAPRADQIWFKTSTGDSYIWIVDENGSRWIQFNTPGPAGPVGPSGSTGASGAMATSVLTYNNTITEPPAAGTIRLDNATLNLATKLWVSTTDKAGSSITVLLSSINSSNMIGLTQVGAAANWVTYLVTGPSVNKTTHWEIPIKFDKISNTVANAADANVQFFGGADADGSTRYDFMVSTGLVPGIKGPVLVSRGGRAWPLGGGGGSDLVLTPDGTLETPQWNLQIDDLLPDQGPLLLRRSVGGRALLLAQPPLTPSQLAVLNSGGSGGGSAGNLFTKAQYDQAQAVANAEKARLNSQDLSPLKRMTDGWRILPHGGQSFDLGSDNGKLHMLDRDVIAKNWQYNGCSISRDPRCRTSGSVYTTYDNDDRKLWPLRENMTDGSEHDKIFTVAQYDRGDYPNNSHGSWPGVLRSFVRQWLRRKWLNQPDVVDNTFLDLPGSWAIADALAIDVFDNNGKARALHWVDIMMQAKAGAVIGASGFTLPASNALGVEVMPIKHGQADNRTNGGNATANYIQILTDFYTAYQAKILSAFGQTEPFAVLMNQVGAPNYGTVKNVCSDQQSDMADDLTGASKWFFLISCQTELPTFWNVTAPHPNAGDAHPSLAGCIILAVRDAVAEHYLIDRKSPYWIPKPMNGFYSGKNFLIPVACMVPGLHEAPMMNGVTPRMMSNKGFSFTNAAGELATVTRINVVPGDYTLIEGSLDKECADFFNGQAGRWEENTGHSGCVEFRDGFKLDNLPLDMPFTANQTLYANPTFSTSVAGNGYRDNPATNGFGRYIEDIPGWVGKYDWGNPVRLRKFTLSPI